MEPELEGGTKATLAAQRDTRLRQTRSLTRWLAAGAVLLAGLFAGIAAQANSGHQRAGTTSSTSTSAPTPATPQAPDAGATPGFAPPDQAPAQTQAPPVAQSGGS